MNIRILVALAAVGALAGCTSVVRGTKQKYPITSEPSAAAVVIKRVYATGEKKGQEVSVGSQQVCTTPCYMKLKRGRNVTITLSKPGYKTQEVLVQSKVTGSGVGTMTAGNLLLGGGIGAIVDASNGSTRSLYPDHVNAVLVPDAAPAAPAEAAPAEASPPAASPEPAATPAPVPPQAN